MEVRMVISGNLAVIFLYMTVAHTYEIERGPYITFPTEDVPTNATSIYIKRVNMSIIPQDTFNEFYQLHTFIIHNNPLVTMPNLIPVGNTLKTLIIVNCKLAELNATVYNELRVLESLNVRFNPLMSFPDVISGPRYTLTEMVIQDCQLPSFIRVAPYTSLARVTLRRNPIVGDIEEEDLMGMPVVQNLLLEGTGVTGLPASPRLLEQLTTLDITDTDVSIRRRITCIS